MKKDGRETWPRKDVGCCSTILFELPFQWLQKKERSYAWFVNTNADPTEIKI